MYSSRVSLLDLTPIGTSSKYLNMILHVLFVVKDSCGSLPVVVKISLG